MPVSDWVFGLFTAIAALACVYLLGVIVGINQVVDSVCAEQCAPLPHAFVDGACGCVEVMDE
jgi:hypothetical protein